jgi:hypothetical protein
VVSSTPIATRRRRNEAKLKQLIEEHEREREREREFSIKPLIYKNNQVNLTPF